MKQKVVIKVMINDQKSRPKVMKIVVGSFGVESVAWIGDDKNQIEVIGDGLDPAVLTLMLRKKLGYADLVSVEEKKEEKKDEKEENEAKLQETAMPACSCYGPWPYCEAMQVIRDPYYGSWL
ncbi:hypothetical protein LWI29_000111 [Acer saccharum]|uniref:Uncharacterized protein n=1 Tax=Acer saccharum TaxID=4024 RepID=A0AA39VPS5_ACESA|nr:hypothetical protein LWI29_000111 [Acer saccharum]